MAISTVTSKYPILNELNFSQLNNSVSRSRRFRSSEYEHEVKTSDKIQAGVGSLFGTVATMAFMMKRQKVKNPFNLSYGLQDMVLMSGASIAGGVAVGMLGDTYEARKNKFKEGVFQFMNGTVPTWIVSGVLKLSELSEKFHTVPWKICSVILALAVGMYGTATVSNLLFDPFDKVPDRKLSIKDCLANIDDAIGVFVLAKIPFVEKLHLDKLLPAIYAYCGYRAGKSN